MIIADNGRCMLDGKTIDLLVEFTHTIGSIRQMLERHTDEETALALIAECGRRGIGLTDGDSFDVAEFVENLDAIKNGDNGMAN